MTEYHARLSPSGAHRWMACPGSVAAEAGVTEPPSEYAEEGTAGHSLAETCLVNGTNVDAYIGTQIPVGAKNVLITEDLAGAVQKHVDAIRERVEAYTLAGATVELLVDQKVPIGHITGEEGSTGTADVIIISHTPGHTVLDVIDLKLGRGVEVSPDWNPQMMMYASGAIEAQSALYDFDEVNLIIHQPRLRDALDEWRTSASQIEKWVGSAARTAAQRTLEENAPHVPGEKQCRFCKAKPTCRALAEKIQETIKSDFDDLVPESGNALSNEELGSIFPVLPLVEQWVKAVRGRIAAELIEGRVVPGVKLVKGRAGVRKWASKERAEELLKSFPGLETDDIYNKELISPTQADTLLRKGNPLLWEKTEAIIIRTEGAPQVVQEDDKRAALDVSKIEEDFKTENSDG